MHIEWQPPRPIPPFPSFMDKPTTSRLALSALCHNLSHRPQPLPQSSRVTSPSGSSVSQERSSSSPLSHFPHNYETLSPAKTDPSIQPGTEHRLPSINYLRLVSSPTIPPPQLPSRRTQHRTYTHSQVRTSHPASRKPNFKPNTRDIPLRPTPAEFSSPRATSEVAPFRKYSSDSYPVRPVLHCYHDSSQERPLSTVREGSKVESPYSRRRHSCQTSSRVCTNCGILQTRQWVRGENHAWLCHSCGQFWRKNGYPRPRALWNRPTFKRSSRKSKLGSPGVDGTTRMKNTTRQTVSSSFLNGKKMIQWEIRLPPLDQSSGVRDLIGTRAGLGSSSIAFLPSVHIEH